MHEEEYNGILNIAYLASCAINGIVPDEQRVKSMDLHHLFNIADHHLLTGIIAMALESAGINDPDFTQAKGKAISKVVLLDMERESVLKAFEDAGIWYMPLKGSVMKQFYPRTGMRQMCDNDILIDPERLQDAGMIMETLGFDCDHSGSVHSSYYKLPVSNFELHRTLFSIAGNKQIYEYYVDVKDRLIKDEDNSYGFHYSDEDFYIYMIAHEYKHYSGGGIGLRALLDTYVYYKKKAGSMDWDYVSDELKKLGIEEFEAANRGLSLRLLGNEPLTEQDNKILNYMLLSGTYGNLTNRVENRIKRYSDGPFARLRYIWGRLFLPMDVVRSLFPAFAKYPILLPFLPIFRLVRIFFTRRSHLKSELKVLAEYDPRQSDEEH